MKTFYVNIYIYENETEVLLGLIAVKAVNQKEAEKKAKMMTSFSCSTPGEIDHVVKKVKWSDTLQAVRPGSTSKGPDVGLRN